MAKRVHMHEDEADYGKMFLFNGVKNTYPYAAKNCHIETNVHQNNDVTLEKARINQETTPNQKNIFPGTLSFFNNYNVESKRKFIISNYPKDDREDACRMMKSLPQQFLSLHIKSK